MENSQQKNLSLAITVEVKKIVTNAVMTVLGRMDEETKRKVVGTASRNDGITVAVLLAKEQEEEFAIELGRVKKTEVLRSFLSDVILNAGIRPDDMYTYFFEPLLSSSGILTGVYSSSGVRGLFDGIIEQSPELLAVLILEQQDIELTKRS